MAKTRGDFTDILIKRKILGPDQIEEAKGMATQTGVKLQDALVKLNYATAQEVMSSIAEFHNMQFVDLKGITIPSSVVEMVPESVARENHVIPPRRLLAPLTSRIKIMGSIDISEKRRPQDGRIKMSVQGNHFDLRVSLLPTVHGQSTVMRILDRGSIQVSIRDLGFSEEDHKRVQTIIKRPNGIFLVTGPTGSGKTTTLYAALNELNRPDRKIITAEDPVEYYLPGINQVEVKHQIGLDFARIIRSMLRQAPNIILVGEIRDKETAEIAVQASLTGHLVFSTLHTNDAPSAITRLGDIGVPPFLIASSVIAIMAQRLVRVNCPKCKEPYKPSSPEIRSSGISKDLPA